MKTIQEILSRAIIILCLSDRCALEESVIEGKKYSKKVRENQRVTILNWMKKKNYFGIMTQSEKKFFTTKVGNVSKHEISLYDFQYEGIEPCLWSISLLQELSNYNQFVVTDFHPPLQIGREHDLTKLADSCRLKELADIEIQREIAMLWHWRAIEGNNPIFEKQSVEETILSIFGQEYKSILDQIPHYDKDIGEFLVHYFPVNKLNPQEIAKLALIAQWRHHAFEWILSDDGWEDVSTDT
jgi:hypothetical protein